MGYASLLAPCFSCGRIFASNPVRVPSYDNQPICRSCITLVNEQRAARGLALWPVHPDAYEAVSEDELPLDPEYD
jgi:hypothetical protein